jgi:hypothetical protein
MDSATKQAYLALLKEALAAKQSGDTERLAKAKEQVELANAGAPRAAWEGIKRGFSETGRGLMQGFSGDESLPEPQSHGYQVMAAKNPFITGMGEASPYVLASLGTAAATGGAGLIPALLAQAGAAGTVGLMQPGTVTDRLARGATDAALGAVGEGVGRAVIGGVGRALAPGMRPAAADATALVNEAQQAGYKVLPSTRMGPGGDKLRQVVEGGMEATPGGAMALGKVSQDNLEQLARHAGEAIGERVNPLTGEIPGVTDRALARARARIGNTYETVFTSGKTFTIPPVAAKKLDFIEAESIAPFIHGTADPIGASIERLRRMVEEGTINARELHQQQSRLGKQGVQALSGANSNPVLGHGLLDMRSLLLDIAEANLEPAERAAVQQARSQYRVLSALESGGNVDSVTGKINPGTMANYLARRDRAGFLEGGNRSPLYTGVRFLGRAQPALKTPGTAERLWMGSALTGATGGVTGAGMSENDVMGGLAGAGIGAMLPYGIGKAYLRPGMQNWLTRTRTRTPLELLAERMGPIMSLSGGERNQ